jgi:hypothetical protein
VGWDGVWEIYETAHCRSVSCSLSRYRGTSALSSSRRRVDAESRHLRSYAFSFHSCFGAWGRAAAGRWVLCACVTRARRTFLWPAVGVEGGGAGGGSVSSTRKAYTSDRAEVLSKRRLLIAARTLCSLVAWRIAANVFAGLSGTASPRLSLSPFYLCFFFPPFLPFLCFFFSFFFFLSSNGQERPRALRLPLASRGSGRCFRY